MNLKKSVAHAAIVAALGCGAVGVGAAPAHADWQHWDDRGNHVSWNDNQWNDWWRVNRWRNDDRPPWGWGAPPPVYWHGNPPGAYNYWGYQVHPIWRPDLATWGFWLFGIFLPILGV
jgi:hypothetical protein